jgi:hypothetical protein
MYNKMTQVKFTIDTDIVSAFKAKCSAEGVSMTSVVCRWLEARQPAKDFTLQVCTRGERKNAVARCIRVLNEVLENETYYRDAIPEQFEQRFETADQACEQLEEAIGLLEDAY